MATAWGSLTKSARYHIPGDGEQPYSPGDVAVHKLVVGTGMILGLIGVIPAIGIGAAACYFVATEKNVMAMLIGLPIAVAVPAVFYFYGTSVALLFTPSSFLRGPIGQKWLKVAGVKSPAAARALCFTLIALPVAIILVLIRIFRQPA
jgi:hypothetical protein